MSKKTSGADGPSDEDRDAILARRRAFIAAALGSMVGAAAVVVSCTPQPCLSQVQPRSDSHVGDDGSARAPDGAARPDDSGAGADADAEPVVDAVRADTGALPVGKDGGRPSPCLSIAPKRRPTEPAPQPCLTPMRLEGDKPPPRAEPVREK